MKNIHTRTWIAIATALVVVSYVFWQNIWAPIASKFVSNSDTHTFEAAQNTADVNLALPGQEQKTMEQNQIPKIGDDQIGIIDVKVGEGQEAKAGDVVSVQYVGLLTDGTQFDSSKDRGPFTFTLGKGDVIPGFDRGITGMKEGSVRRIVIPPALGYGAQQAGTIPPNSTLLFEVELVKVGK